MRSEDRDPLREIAERVADCFAKNGYAFLEDDHVESLTAALRSFLLTAGIPVDTPDRDGPT